MWKLAYDTIDNQCSMLFITVHLLVVITILYVDQCLCLMEMMALKKWIHMPVDGYLKKTR